MISSRTTRRTMLTSMLTAAPLIRASRARPQAPSQAPASPAPLPPLPPNDPWPGKKKLLAIADTAESYQHPTQYHHDAASHTLAVLDRLGRESGGWITIIRTDWQLLRKAKIEGMNARTLDYFDAVFLQGEPNWDITDQQKADLLAFVHDEGKGLIGGHAGNGGHFLLWPEYAEMIGGDLAAEFPTTDLPIIVEDPKFPGVQGFKKEFWFRDQLTVVGKHYDRNIDHVILRMDPNKIKEASARLRPEPNSGITPERARIQFDRAAAAARPDGDMPIVWARKYGKGRVFYSSFGHEDAAMDDPRVQKLTIGGIKWALGLVDADITPKPYPGK